MHYCLVSALILQADSKEKFPKSIITFLSGSGSRNCRDIAANLLSTPTEDTPKTSEALASQVKEVNFFSSKAGKKSCGLNTERPKKSSSGQPLTVFQQVWLTYV